MALNADRQMQPETMLGQIEDVLCGNSDEKDPAYTVILGAGASFGVVPTAKQMLGIADKNIVHPLCVPAWKARLGPQCSADDLAACVRKFWDDFEKCNPGKVRLENGVPTADRIADAYQHVFDQKLRGGINTPGKARDYLRDVTMKAGSPIQLNGTHFFLASLLALQNRGDEEGYGENRLYVGERPFARTIFTTNFDPLLQISLQIFGLLYYMTDRPDQMAPDALRTDDHPAMHLFYAHGSVHRPFLANTNQEIEHLKDKNALALAPYLSGHGVIVLGYSGWDDCLLHALDKTASFKHNLYWLARGEASLSPRVQKFLSERTNAFWVPIQDGGEFMASLHRRLCPGMLNTELLQNPIRTLLRQVKSIDLSGIPAERQPTSQKEATASGVSAPVQQEITPSQFHTQVIGLLEIAEARFNDSAGGTDASEELQKLEHQADTSQANRDWVGATESYTKIIEHPLATVGQKARALYRRAYSYNQQGKIEEEISDYSRTIELPGAPPEQVAWSFVNRGYSYGKLGKTGEEISDYSRAIELSGASPEQLAVAFVNRGICYAQMGELKHAIADFSRAIELPGAPPAEVAGALLNRGFCYAQIEEGDQEVSDYSRAIELPGAQPEQVAMGLVNRGICHAQTGKSKEAISDYSKAMELSGAPPEQIATALVNRGICYSQMGKSDEAISDFSRATELPGAPPEQIATGLIHRGICYGQLGESEKEISDYSCAIELPGAPPEQIAMALVNRGICYSKIGKSDEAISDFSRAIKLPGAPPEQIADATRLRSAFLVAKKRRKKT